MTTATLVTTDGRPKQYALFHLDALVATGVLGGTERMATPLEVVAEESEVTFVAALALTAAALPELPDSGWLEAGAVYAHKGAALMVRQSHWRTEHDPADVPALFWTVNTSDAWIVGERVEVGARRTYGGKTWACIQAHTTQADWTPPAMPALWAEVVVTPPTGRWAVGVTYKVGDEVTYKGLLYRCRQAHTSIVTWEPPKVLALWLPI